MQRLFLIFLVEFFRIIFSVKTEIKFTLNVPSLFRCKKNGPIYYFRNFPTDQLFVQTIKNSGKDCDLILIPANKRVIFDVQKHHLQCAFQKFNTENRVNEILFFKSNCLMNGDHDLCSRLTPKTATIISDYLTASYRPVSIDLSITGIGTENIQIGDENQFPYSLENHGYLKSGVRIYQVVFKVKNDEYLNMMCRYSYINNPQDKNAICRLGFFTKNRFQTRSGTTTAKGEGWSWLCYYYPSGVEQPLDYKMISKANEDFEKASAITKPSVIATLSSSDFDEFFNGSTTTLNETEKSSSKSMISLLIISIIAGGIICICKYKCQTKSEESRSSLESQISDESTENDDD